MEKLTNEQVVEKMTKVIYEMMDSMNELSIKKAIIDGIPVVYLEPTTEVKERKLAIFLGGLGMNKELLGKQLSDIAGKGYVALSFDLYKHGDRENGNSQEIAPLVFSNFRRYGWVVLGQTVIDAERVIDWAIENLNVIPEIYMGGFSMGGDIAIAAAGLDKRIVRVAPVITTPDWMRPGMKKDDGELMDTGKADSYSKFYFDNIDPFTNIKRYIDSPPMRLVLGREDDHIPPENAERFRNELSKIAPEAASRIEIVYVEGPNANHKEVIMRNDEWWPSLLEWWLG